jgi:hypothetical protein
MCHSEQKYRRLYTVRPAVGLPAAYSRHVGVGCCVAAKLWCREGKLKWHLRYRKGVYYLSVAAAGFLILIIALAVVRLVVFCAVWALTFGKHHFWLFPNLTEDVGFLASFWPIYQVKHCCERATVMTLVDMVLFDSCLHFVTWTAAGDGRQCGTVCCFTTTQHLSQSVAKAIQSVPSIPLPEDLC